MDLMEIREELDRVDRELVRLYGKRLELCREVAGFKSRTGKKVLDPEREQQKLEAVAALAEKDFDRKAVRELYQQIMTISRRLQLGMIGNGRVEAAAAFREIPEIEKNGKKVVYQGVEGAYAHLAARRLFPEGQELYHVKTWRAALEEVVSGVADYAVLPFENSSHGTIQDNLDLLLEYPGVSILQELDLKVEHALMGCEGSTLEGLHTVCSHPEGLAQCSGFFLEHPEIEAVPVLNTAAAAQLVAREQDPGKAALASEEAAELYGLKILKRQVNQSRTNTTRFVLVGPETVYQAGAGKISLCFETSHQPGALYNVLGNFIFNDVNMTMIQSRPIPERAFEYRFFVTIEGNLRDTNAINALAGIEDQITALRILGNYQAAADPGISGSKD